MDLQWQGGIEAKLSHLEDPLLLASPPELLPTRSSPPAQPGSRSESQGGEGLGSRLLGGLGDFGPGPPQGIIVVGKKGRGRSVRYLHPLQLISSKGKVKIIYFEINAETALVLGSALLPFPAWGGGSSPSRLPRGRSALPSSRPATREELQNQGPLLVPELAALQCQPWRAALGCHRLPCKSFPPPRLLGSLEGACCCYCSTSQ